MMLSTLKGYQQLPKRMPRNIRRPSGKPSSFTRKLSSGVWLLVQRKLLRRFVYEEADGDQSHYGRIRRNSTWILLRSS
jgi:hypothetical protein